MQIDVGIPQGGVTSPRLLGVYIDPVMVECFEIKRIKVFRSAFSKHSSQEICEHTRREGGGGVGGTRMKKRIYVYINMHL